MNHSVLISNWCNWTSSRRANSKWYNIIAHPVLKFEFWLKYLFFLFHFALISSHSFATCPREKCVHTIHQSFIIEIHINRIIFPCFFLLSFLSFKMMFVDAKKAFLVYYWIEVSFVYYEAFVDWLYVDSESFMTILNLRWKCVMNALRFHFTFYYFYFWSFFFKSYCCSLK